MSDQKLDPQAVQSLTSALLEASGETHDAPLSTRPTPADRSRANLRRIHAEEGLRCPECGFEGSEDQFSEVELDSDSDGYKTDEEAGRTDGDAAESLAKALLKSANASQNKQSNGLKSGPALTADEATKLIQAALKNLRR